MRPLPEKILPLARSRRRSPSEERWPPRDDLACNGIVLALTGGCVARQFAHPLLQSIAVLPRTQAASRGLDHRGRSPPAPRGCGSWSAATRPLWNLASTSGIAAVLVAPGGGGPLRRVGERHSAGTAGAAYANHSPGRVPASGRSAKTPAPLLLRLTQPTRPNNARRAKSRRRQIPQRRAHHARASLQTGRASRSCANA